MDRIRNLSRSLLAVTLLSAATTGCIAPKQPVDTFWQKLGIPQTGARLRDGFINRNGNHPDLEKKPPVLALADPQNLESPVEAIKVAAKIKQDEDLKQQKIKALKYLATVGCGCHEEVEGALLKSLEDCDCEIRIATLEAIQAASGACQRCQDGCAATCCTEAIQKKLEDMATGMKDGCFKEPVPGVRAFAARVLAGCPPLPPKPTEAKEDKKTLGEGDVPTKPQDDNPLKEGGDEAAEEPAKDEEAAEKSASAEPAMPSRITLSDASYGSVDIHPVVFQTVSKPTPPAAVKAAVSNPDQLVASTVKGQGRSSNEVIINLPTAYDLAEGSSMVIVSGKGGFATGRIVRVDGTEVCLRLDDVNSVPMSANSQVHVGLLGE